MRSMGDSVSMSLGTDINFDSRWELCMDVEHQGSASGASEDTPELLLAMVSWLIENTGDWVFCTAASYFQKAAEDTWSSSWIYMWMGLKIFRKFDAMVVWKVGSVSPVSTIYVYIYVLLKLQRFVNSCCVHVYSDCYIFAYISSSNLNKLIQKKVYFSTHDRFIIHGIPPQLTGLIVTISESFHFDQNSMEADVVKQVGLGLVASSPDQTTKIEIVQSERNITSGIIGGCTLHNFSSRS